MSKLNVIIFDSSNNIKYHLGEVEVQPEGTISTFTVQFQLTKEKFEVLSNELTNHFNKEKEVYTYEVVGSSVKAKKPKKPARKG